MTQIKHLGQCIFLFLLLLGVMSWQPAVAQEEDVTGVSMSARAGFDGYYRQQNWVPVQVTVANDGPAVEGELRMTIGSFNSGDRVIYTAPLSLPTQSNKRVMLYVDIPSILSNPVVELRDENGRLIAEVETNPLRQMGENSLLYGIVSSEPGELEFLENITGTRLTAAAAFLAMDELPEVPTAWDSLDVLIFNDVDSGELTTRQQDALRKWVSMGGQLVVTGGAGWQKSTAVFSDMLPVTLSGSESIADLPNLTAEIGLPFRDPGPYVVATSSLRSGDLLFHEAGLPLLARQGWGRGQVYFLALDPKLAPLVDWDGSEILWATVANDLPINPYWWSGVQNSYAAETAVSSLPSLTLPSVLGLVAFLLLYVIIIGPVNYLFLKRRKQRELAWASIPVMVLIFSGIAYLTGFQLKGNEVILNQMAVVYGRIGGENLRVQSLLGLYSPGRSTFDLVLPTEVMARPFERSFGNMGGSGNIDAISRSTNLTLENIRVDVSGVESFVIEGYRDGLPMTGQASLNQDGGDILLDVNIQNNSDLLFETATILLGNRAYPLGDIAPGAEVNMSQRVGRAQSSPSTSFTFSSPISISSGGAPLVGNAELILGTANYYDDRNVYPRWQLLEALDSSSYGMFAPTLPANTVTLTAWAEQPQISAALEERDFREMATSLFLLEIPLTQNLVSGDNVSLPLQLLQWSVLDQNNVYDANVQNLYLNYGSAVDFAYVPWQDMQKIQVSRLEIVLEPQPSSSTTLTPELFLWDWQKEKWELQAVSWGETNVEDYDRFLGPNNDVHIRLRSNEYNVEIREVYPRLTGSLR